MAFPLIPVILGVVSLVLAGAGLKAGHRGRRRFQEAKGKCAAAQAELTSAKEQLENRRELLLHDAEEYREYLIRIRDTTFRRAEDILHRVGGVRGERTYTALSDVTVTMQDLAEFKAAVAVPSAMLEGGVRGAAIGAAASQSVVAAVTLYGSASTGVSIAGLSGAAANSATLAWLGGGAVAAGGGGVAAGTIVLGGVAIGPAIAVGGWAVSAKGERALTEATAFAAEVNEAVERLKFADQFLEKVRAQVDERRKLLLDLEQRANSAMDMLSGDLDSVENHENAFALQRTMLFVKAISEIMMAPVLDSGTGKLDAKGLSIIAEYKVLVDQGGA